MGRGGDARTIVGYPFVPPAAFARAMLAVRRRLAWAHREMAPPPIRVLEAVFGMFDNRALALLVELGVPDHLDRPRSTAELAEVTGSDSDALGRLLRYAAGRGFVGSDRQGRWRENAVSAMLRRDHPHDWRGWVEFAGSDWFWDAWRHADRPLRDGRSGLEDATGTTFFDFVNRVRPDAGDAFNRAMAAGSTVQALALSQALDWSGVQTVCDVGGGTGANLELLLRAHPHLEGVLFDIPEVVAAARPALAAGGDLAGRCRLEAGSFFEAVPEGADRYLLLAIVHDWDDEPAAALLSRVAAAMHPGARAVVVDGVLAERPRGDLTEATDVLMAVLVTGRERTAAQFERVFAAAGLRLEQAPLFTGFTAHVLARA